MRLLHSTCYYYGKLCCLLALHVIRRGDFNSWDWEKGTFNGIALNHDVIKHLQAAPSIQPVMSNKVLISSWHCVRTQRFNWWFCFRPGANIWNMVSFPSKVHFIDKPMDAHLSLPVGMIWIGRKLSHCMPGLLAVTWWYLIAQGEWDELLVWINWLGICTSNQLAAPRLSVFDLSAA